MVFYVFSDVIGQTVTFNAATDVITSASLSAFQLELAQSGTNVLVTGPGGSFTLSNLTVGQLRPGNFSFGDTSTVAVGDLLATDAADSGDNVINFLTDGALIPSLNKNNLVYGLAGNDTIVLTGSGGANAIYGGAGGDAITAGNGTNFIYGGSGVTDTTDGADTIIAGSGANTIYGNAGADLISFSTPLTVGVTATVYGGLGADSITGSNASGTFLLDAGADNDTVTILTSSANHTLIGGLGADSIDLTGSTGDLLIYGGSGQTDSADGADTVVSGVGNLTFYGNAGADRLTLNTLGGKTAFVHLGIGNDSLTSGAIGANVTIYGGGGSDSINLTGHTANATIYGGDGVNDAADGADTIIAGGVGDVLIYANGGADQITVSTPTAKSIVVYGGAANDTFKVNFTSTAGTANIRDFGTGTDILNVTLTGGDAADLTITRDAVVGTTLTNASGEVLLLSGFTGNFSATNFVLSDASRLLTNFGGAAATLTGTDFDDKVLTGSNGDTVVAGAGVDIFTGGSGNDTFQFQAVNFTAADAIHGGDGTDVLELTLPSGNINDSLFALKGSLETLKLTGGDYSATAITLASNASATGFATVNATGATGSNFDALSLSRALTFSGSTGVDTLIATVYNDTINGAGGADILFGNIGADSITGGSGSDVFSYNANFSIIPSEGGDIITDFDAGTSSTAADKLSFSAAALSYNLGDNNTTVVGAIVSSIVAAGTLGTELVVLNTVGIATADTVTSLNTLNASVQSGKGVIDVFYDTSVGHALVYYDSNGGAAGGHSLVAELTSVTSLSDMTKFDFTDFTFI